MGAAAIAAVGAADPNVPGRWPVCPLLLATGHWCPGCGALRSVHALTQGDLLTALARHPLVPPALLWLLLDRILRARRAAMGLPHPRPASPWRVWALLAVILVFGVARNLPGAALLSPL